MKSIRPDHQEPLAGPAQLGQKPGLGRITARFVVLLIVAIGLLALAWHR